MKEQAQPSTAERMREAVRRKADHQVHTWESRTKLVKEQLAAASAANDAKTARLRALRLEKERQEAEAAPPSPPPDSPRPARKPVRRVNVN